MDTNELFQKIEYLEKEVSELKNRKSGFQRYFGRAFRKTNVIAGIVITVMIASAVLFAAQTINLTEFVDGGVISAGEVNNNFLALKNSVLAVEQNAQSAESFLGEIVNDIDIETNNSGPVKFAQKQNSNSDIFEVVTDSPFGVKIKKAGTIFFNYDQDVMTTSAGNYVYLRSQIDSTTISDTALRPTGNLWDGIHNGGAYHVSENQILTFTFGSSGTDITAIDNQTWGRMSILWIGKNN